jgi:hypothetical protein
MRKGTIAALIALGVLTVLSLVLNGVVIVALLRFARIGQEALAQGRTMLAAVRDETFAYNFAIDEEFPVKTTVPVEDEFTVPFQSTIPVNTTVTVPIDLGFMTYNLRVPINTVFPLDMEFTVPVSMSMDVDISVPISMEVPVEIRVDETPFAGYLLEMEETLDDLEHQMSDPLGVGVDPLQLAEDYLGK